jgi:hypothetical protein
MANRNVLLPRTLVFGRDHAAPFGGIAPTISRAQRRLLAYNFAKLVQKILAHELQDGAVTIVLLGQARELHTQMKAAHKLEMAMFVLGLRDFEFEMAAVVEDDAAAAARRRDEEAAAPRAQVQAAPQVQVAVPVSGSAFSPPGRFPSAPVSPTKSGASTPRSTVDGNDCFITNSPVPGTPQVIVISSSESTPLRSIVAETPGSADFTPARN